MAVVNLTLYVNVTRQILQASSSNGAEVPCPSFTVGDVYDLKVLFVEQTGTGFGASSFTVLSPGSLGCKVGIGVRGASPLVLQDTFTVSGNFLVAQLDCTPAGYASAVDAGTHLYLEVKAGDSGNFKTVYQEACVNRRAVSTSASVSPAPVDQYYSKAEIDALFVRKVNAAGVTVTFTSPDGASQRIIGVNDDKSAADNVI